MLSRHLLRASSVALLLLGAGCGVWKDSVADKSKLDGEGRGDLGLDLHVAVAGAQPSLVKGLGEAMRAELEQADLFDEVSDPVLAPVTSLSGTAGVTTHKPSGSSRLEIVLTGESTGIVHDFWRQVDGFYARYELDTTLIDRSGSVILAGHVSVVACAAASDPDELSPVKKADVVESAQRDAACKIGRALRAAADVRAKAAFEALERIRLPAGIGPVPIAVLGFDDDPAARRRRGPALARALAPAFGRLGPDLSVVAPEEVEAELGGDISERRSFMALKEEDLDRLVPRLGARLFIVGKIDGGAGRTVVRAQVMDQQLRVIGETSAEAEGPGSLKLIAVQLARGLGQAIEQNPPTEPARRDDE